MRTQHLADGDYTNISGRCICYGDPQPDLFEWLDAEDFTKLFEL